MTTPMLTAAMIKAGADWLKEYDADDNRDYGYEQLVEMIFRTMVAGGASQQRWDDALARELVRTGKLRGTR